MVMLPSIRPTWRNGVSLLEDFLVDNVIRFLLGTFFHTDLFPLKYTQSKIKVARETCQLHYRPSLTEPNEIRPGV